VLKFQELVHITDVIIYKISKLKVCNHAVGLIIAIMAFLDLPLFKHIYAIFFFGSFVVFDGHNRY